MEIVIVWGFAALIVGIFANKLNRSGFAYFLLSVVLSPVLVGLLLLVIGKAAATGPVANVAQKTTADQDQTRCPECRELVRIDACKCKHCGAALTPTSEATPNPVIDRTPSALPRNW